jgi:hypothetical protein
MLMAADFAHASSLVKLLVGARERVCQARLDLHTFAERRGPARRSFSSLAWALAT